MISEIKVIKRIIMGYYEHHVNKSDNLYKMDNIPERYQLPKTDTWNWFVIKNPVTKEILVLGRFTGKF